MKAGGVGLRTNVVHRDVEGGVAEMLPLRREVLHMDPVLRSLHICTRTHAYTHMLLAPPRT